MKSASNRIKIMLFFILLTLVGLVFFLVSLFTQGSTWAMSSRNTHLYSNGTLIGAGSVYDAEGKALVTTENGERVYIQDSSIRTALLHTIGDNEGFIAASVQNEYKDELSGYNKIMGVWELTNFEKGSSVTLTVQSDVCVAALNALGTRKGAVCVYNYKTGEVVCSVSTPSYDPQNKPSDIDDEEKYDGVYINRVTSGLYPPGSTFKTITAAAALETQNGIADKQFKCDGAWHSGYGDVTCMDVHGSLNMGKALTVSCNSAFAEIANETGGEVLAEYAERFGFNSEITLNKINVSESVFKKVTDDPLELGWQGIGQSTTLATPLLMARAMSAFANGGVPTEPYIIKKVTNPLGFDSFTASTKTGKQIIEASTADTLKEMMRDNVINNYGDWNFKEGLNVCAKSGTAEVEEDKEPHAWFVGFCDSEEYPYAFSVIVENGGSGSSVACPIAAQVLNTIAGR